MNNAKKLTISYISNNSDNPASVPYLRLRGLWLEKLGWEIGEKVEVEANEKEIIIRKTASNTNNDSQDKGRNCNDSDSSNQPSQSHQVPL